MNFIKLVIASALMSITAATNYMIVMLPTYNDHIIDSIAHNVSNPTHPEYGKYLSRSEVEQIVSDPIVRAPWLSWFSLKNVNYSDIGDGFVLHDPVQIPSFLQSTALHLVNTSQSRKPRRNGSPRPRHRSFSPRDNITGISPRTSINSLYGVPNTFITSEKVTQSVIEFQDDSSFSLQDAKKFTNATGLPDIKYKSIGPFDGDDPDGEATLDIQIQIAVGRGAKQFYITTTGWLYEATTLLLAMDSPPLVNSMSWGWNAHDQCSVSPCGNLTSIQYINRVNNEFAKLAARGITMLSSSGDSGSYGRTNEACDTVTTYESSPLRPVFPTSSPWVTSVGGTVVVNQTLLPKNNSRTGLCRENNCVVGGDQTVCSFDTTGWTSGGGISWDFPVPVWQKIAAADYYSSGTKLPPQKYFNKSGRIYPDVSLVANDYLIYLDGGWQLLAGTSASCPAFSGMVSQWNEARIKRGQPVVGAVNPLLYHLYSVCDDCFVNVQGGSNDGTESMSCNSGWYTASKGKFDPVYGLGLPNMTAIIKY